MNINLKALLYTVGFLSSVVGITLGGSYLLSVLDPAYPGYVSIGMLLGALVYLTFNMIKYRLEREETLKQLNNRYE